MKWYRKLAERKRPNYIGDNAMGWYLVVTKWFGLALTLRYRSDSTFDQRAEANRITVILEGTRLRHYEVPRTGEHEPAIVVPKDAYTYGDKKGLWASVKERPKTVSREIVGHRGGIELLPAQRLEDRLVNLPTLRHEELVFDSEAQVWALVFVWGGAWNA